MAVEDVHLMSLGISPSESNGSSIPTPTPGKEQQAAGVGILLQIMMLVLSFVLGHVLRRHKFYYLPEASASLLIAFTQSGFSLQPKPFFSNFGAIVTFAILGTFIASIVTGVLVYLGGLVFLMYKLPFVECLMFGALISATDPVTVLSIFQELGTDMNLYALVFGESVLNDAMAISLYRTMATVKSHASSGENFFMVVFRFLETFVGSMSAGLDIDKYMLAEGLGLSGIVSILFTGIVMKHYSYSNLSENSQRFVSAFFHLISSLAETFVAANVFSCAYLVNLVRPAHRKIPLKHQKALWYSGLRGAMAFALALQSVHDLPEGHGQTIFTATTAIVVLTVLLIGGSTGTMLEALEVVGDGHDGSLPLGDSFEGNNGYLAPSTLNYEENHGYQAPPLDEEPSSGNRIKMKLKEFHKSTTSFSALDRNYLTPFFTSQNGDDEDENESSLLFLYPYTNKLTDQFPSKTLGSLNRITTIMSAHISSLLPLIAPRIHQGKWGVYQRPASHTTAAIRSLALSIWLLPWLTRSHTHIHMFMHL
ncbi:hypothetical protein TIFTF001_006260 [Ficus carica]|uniref:Cation/H+ exchanger transmembrane domain-containing protein n=1 Tax=Ficus carica TaxID=3494 RepID=A0AA88DFH8_FICCA|nr:hypothetical protein TIFTF001_006260 [Ficus carica]